MPRRARRLVLPQTGQSGDVTVLDRYANFRPREILKLVGVLLAVAIVLKVVLIAHTVITWILIAAFLSLAINPAVEWLQRRGVRRRGAAVAIIFVLTLLVIAAAAGLIIPTLAKQISDFVNAVPGYVNDLTHGRGPLGFLETKYHVVEKAKEAVGNGGGTKLLSHFGALLSVGKGVATFVTATLTIIFLTLFMLLEGKAWIERAYASVPEARQQRVRTVGRQVYETVGGYVTGNLLISLVCGTVYGLALLILGAPYALALGFIAALLDLVPLAGATIGGLIVVGVAFTESTVAGIVMAAVVIVYQQLENHVLQPVIYGRTVDLSPLAVLIAVLIGAEVAGVVGALAAIPVAGTLQVVLRSYLEHRREQRDGTAVTTAPPPAAPAPG